MQYARRIPRVLGWGMVLALLAAYVPAALPQAQKLRPAAADDHTWLPKIGIYSGAGSDLYAVEVGAKVFSDGDATIESVAPEMVGLTGLRAARGAGLMAGSTAPVQLLIGYVKGGGNEWAKPPAGQKPAIANAAKIGGLLVDVYTLNFGKNNYRTGGPVNVPSPGAVVVLGAIPAEVKITPWDAKGGQSN